MPQALDAINPIIRLDGSGDGVFFYAYKCVRLRKIAYSIQKYCYLNYKIQEYCYTQVCVLMRKIAYK
jgi:hypothetical protein